MTPKITPTQGFILVQHVSREGQRTLFLPDGQRDPEGDIIVLAVGPDVPGNPPIAPGDKILLRGDAKVFAADPNDKDSAMVDYRSIMGVFSREEGEGEGTEPLPFTDEEIAQIAASGNGTQHDASRKASPEDLPSIFDPETIRHG